MRFRPEWGTDMSAWGNAPGIGSTQKPKPQRGDTGFAAMIRKNFGAGELNERTERSNMPWYMNTNCAALSGHNGRGGIVTQGVALGWHVDGPLARNAGITRNAIPPRTGHQHVSLGHRPRYRP